MSLIPPKPLCAGGKRVPALPVYAVPVSPVAGSKSATLFSSAAFIPACGFAVSALMLWVSAMRNCVSKESAQADAERFSRCHRQNVPELFRFQNRCAVGYAPSRCGLCTVAASGVSGYLSRFLRRAFTGGSDPAWSHRLELNQHLPITRRLLYH